MQSRMSAAVASTLTKNFSESWRTEAPNSQQSKAKRALQEIWTAETKKDALTAFDALEPHRNLRAEGTRWPHSPIGIPET